MLSEIRHLSEITRIAGIVVLQFECLCHFLSSMGSILVTKYLISYVIKGFYLPSLSLVRHDTDTIRYTCSPSNGLLTIGEKISCAFAHDMVGYHLFSIYHHLKDKGKLNCHSQYFELYSRASVTYFCFVNTAVSCH
jgi:hypothetical protein